ncbi:MAG: ParB/RepB/Spo0J family partition protein [Dehalococcoidia bacterium]|jgi:hypothetical protein
MKSKESKESKKLEIVYLSASALVKLPGNPRRDKDPKAIEKLSKLIRLHGFQNPLQVFRENGKYTILCGNHRFDAGLSLGMKEFPCLVYTGDKKAALARAISDNRSNEWTEWDMPILKELFIDLDTGDFDIHLTGFNSHELELMMTAVHQEEPDRSLMDKVFNAGKGQDESGGGQSDGSAADKFPITFILDQAEWEAWVMVKGRLKVKDDKSAFLKLIGGKSNA